jgi:putative FmdB family regulatory protein
MPIYEYRCRKCGRGFEALVLPSRPGPECPGCGKTDLEQMISLCSVSSEGSRAANLKAAHAKAGSVRKDRLHEAHKEGHRHFED